MKNRLMCTWCLTSGCIEEDPEFIRGMKLPVHAVESDGKIIKGRQARKEYDFLPYSNRTV